MNALKTWNGGVILISHDERFITSVANEVCRLLLMGHHCCLTSLQLWVCADGKVDKFRGDVQAYKVCSRSTSHHPADKPRTPTELDRKQHQSETVNLPWQYSNIITLPRVTRPEARTECELPQYLNKPPPYRTHLA